MDMIEVARSELARNAYAAATRPIRTPRGIEYEVFAKITNRLRAADGDTPGGFATLAAALRDNHQLWTLLAADVADPENGLEATLRARIFYLSEFTRRHTSKILAGLASQDILVEINSAVMGGLRGEGRAT